MCFHEWESQGCTGRGCPENKQVRPGLKLSLFLGPCRSLEEGQ